MKGNWREESPSLQSCGFIGAFWRRTWWFHELSQWEKPPGATGLVSVVASFAPCLITGELVFWVFLDATRHSTTARDSTIKAAVLAVGWCQAGALSLKSSCRGMNNAGAPSQCPGEGMATPGGTGFLWIPTGSGAAAQ